MDAYQKFTELAEKRGQGAACDYYFRCEAEMDPQLFAELESDDNMLFNSAERLNAYCKLHQEKHKAPFMVEDE